MDTGTIQELRRQGYTLGEIAHLIDWNGSLERLGQIAGPMPKNVIGEASPRGPVFKSRQGVYGGGGLL